jgi:hypothetical protein
MLDQRALRYKGTIRKGGSLSSYSERDTGFTATKNKVMKIPKIKDDESLAMWRERLAQEFNLDPKMQEILREVSVTSYMHGTNMILDTLKKEGRLIDN